MPTPSDTVYAFVNKMISKEEAYVLPSIQRPYVWKEKQVCQLFDSVMRGYPLGTLLTWKTRQDLRTREFCPNWSKKLSNELHPDEGVKNVVLDGQQRLQSLLIGMRGTYEGKTLYLRLNLNPVRESYDDTDGMAYHFKFYKVKPTEPGWVSVPELTQNKESSAIKLGRHYASADKSLSDFEELIVANVERFKHNFKTEAHISYNVIDEVSHDGLHKSLEDIVEIFVRTNNGGTKLNKSDLLFSLLSSKWEPAYENVTKLEERLNHANFDLGKDYILKATLMCVGQKASYQVSKFKKPGVLEDVQKEWSSISNALIHVVGFLQKNTPITSSKSLVSQNSILPLVYMRHNMKAREWSELDADAVAEYILITSLAGSFNGAKDSLLDQLAESMKDKFDLQKALGLLKSANRTIEFDAQKIWAISYKQQAKVYFAISKVVKGSNLQSICQTHIDHIIAKDLLTSYTASDVNQLANLTILDQSENTSKGKKTLLEWLKGRTEAQRRQYCETHQIPMDESLWAPSKFHEFIKARKELILANTEMGKLLSSGRANAASENADIEDDSQDE